MCGVQIDASVQKSWLEICGTNSLSTGLTGSGFVYQGYIENILSIIYYTSSHICFSIPIN